MLAKEELWHNYVQVNYLSFLNLNISINLKEIRNFFLKLDLENPPTQ